MPRPCIAPFGFAAQDLSAAKLGSDEVDGHHCLMVRLVAGLKNGGVLVVLHCCCSY